MRFLVTLKKHPDHIAANEYKHIDNRYQIFTAVSNREEPQDNRKKQIALEKAVRFAREQTGYPFTVPSCLESIEIV